MSRFGSAELYAIGCSMSYIIKPSSKWRAIAIHEASHATLAIFFGGNLQEIRINPLSRIKPGLPLAQAVFQPKHKDPYKLMQIFAAGPIGEELFQEFSGLSMKHIPISLERELNAWTEMVRKYSIEFDVENMVQDWRKAQEQAKSILSVDKISTFVNDVANRIIYNIKSNDIIISGETFSSLWPTDLKTFEVKS